MGCRPRRAEAIPHEWRFFSERRVRITDTIGIIYMGTRKKIFFNFLPELLYMSNLFINFALGNQ